MSHGNDCLCSTPCCPLRRNYNGKNAAGSNASEGHHGNLHDRHPTRYPKRSGLTGGLLEEGEEQEGNDGTSSNDDASGDENGARGKGVKNNSSTDEGGLFRRVDKVRKELMEGKQGKGK